MFILLFLPFTFNFFLSSYFYSPPFSPSYKLSIYQRKYKQSSYGLDTQSSILVFIACDKIGTLANLLTSFWRRCRGLCPSYLVVTYPNLKAIFLYFVIFLYFILFYLFYLDNLHGSVLFSCMRGIIAGEKLVPLDLEIKKLAESTMPQEKGGNN